MQDSPDEGLPDAPTSAIAAAVIGAAHARLGRNGQDAVASWSDGVHGVVVVCDGCGSGARSELGALYTARALCAAMARRLAAGECPGEQETWEAARAEVVAGLRALLDGWRVPAAAGEGDGGDGDGDDGGQDDDRAALEEHLLCTAIAAAKGRRAAAVWAIGDGAFVLDGELHQLGPFPDNAPPYLAYDLVGAARPARFTACSLGGGGTLLVASDGAAALGAALVELTAEPRFLEHPDALRRTLAQLARPAERIAWAERRVERTAAALQDDAAIGLLRWGRP